MKCVRARLEESLVKPHVGGYADEPHSGKPSSLIRSLKLADEDAFELNRAGFIAGDEVVVISREDFEKLMQFAIETGKRRGKK